MSFRIIHSDGQWLLEGVLNQQVASLLKEWQEGLQLQEETIHLEMVDLEIDDSEAMHLIVEMLRSLSLRSTSVVLHNVPHTLAHVLYRIGMIEPGCRVQISEWREEEPYG